MNPTTQEVRAAWIANNQLIPPKTIYRIDGAGERFYYSLREDGYPEFYGSVTSIKKQVTGLAQGIIDKWVQLGDTAFRAYSNNKAHFGTFWHIEAAELTQNGKYDLTTLNDKISAYAAAHPDCGDTSWWYDSAWKGLLSWWECMKDFNIKPIAIEIPLAHPYGYAGTIDLVCSKYVSKYTEKTPENERKREFAIIDWKTGYVYPDHAFQLELNKRCFHHNFANTGITIQGLYNFSLKDWRTKPTYEFKNQTGSSFEDQIDDYLTLWSKIGKKRPSDILVPGKTIQTDVDELYSRQSIDEYLKTKHMENKNGV